MNDKSHKTMKTNEAKTELRPGNTPHSALRIPHSDRVSRRKFILAGGAAAAGFTIVPRHVLGGPGFVPPSEKITLAYIGCGTQGLREMPGMLAMPEVQIVAVCDPVKESHDYLDWSKDGLRSEIARALGNPDWRRNAPGIAGGREVAREIIETSYATQKRSGKFKSCAAYADFRELLEKEKDVTAVKIMTPDHLHATIAVAAMKRGKHVLMHKPLANRLQEARLVIETARKTRVATHFLPASDGANIRTIKAAIKDGAIGTLRQIHNWSNRPVWPQYATIPTESPSIPEGFDCQLGLGGWYEFGGGALADMGHYSLWPVFQLFDLEAPVSVESRPSHLCTRNGNVAGRIKNDYSFPSACTIRFKFAAKGDRPALDLFWYDGSMKPPTPEELEPDKELETEGMMFVGDKGKIIAGFRGETPQIMGGERLEVRGQRAERGQREALAQWVGAVRGGKPTFGDFLLAGPISDAFNLAAVSLRLGGKRLLFDSANMKITNVPEANNYLVREYRKGWELHGV